MSLGACEAWRTNREGKCETQVERTRGGTTVLCDLSIIYARIYVRGHAPLATTRRQSWVVGTPVAAGYVGGVLF